MGSDVAKSAPRPTLLRISTPERLLLPGLLQRRGQPVLRVLHLNDSNLAKFSVGNHLPGLPDHGISGVVVSHGKEKAGAADGLSQAPRVFKSRRKRLVANDVDASLEKRLRRRVMQMVGSDNRNRVDAVFSARFLGSHFGEAAVGPIRRDVQINGPGG